MYVLAVDDDSASRYLIESILRSAGHHVVTAHDGVEALEAARAEPPDLLISDILMPRMDGYQLCREWKADDRLAAIPLVFYTASYTDPADERFALSLGADAFWRKPLEARELLGAIGSIVDGDGSCAVRQPVMADESVVLQAYNARLVDKLEDKARRLESANAELRKAMDALARESMVKERLIDELNADVMAREVTEAELRTERDFSRGVLELADLFICILDADRRITLVSSGAERVCGRTAQELLGIDLAGGVVSPGTRLMLGRALDSLPASDVRRCEIDIARSSETSTIECVITCSLDADGRPASYNVFGVDVTERRRLEELKSDFIQTVSHEFRTPLTSIVGFVDMLGSLSAGRLEDRAPAIIERLKENAHKMRVLVEELLEVNDIAADGIALLTRPVDLGALVRRSAEAVYRGPDHTLEVTVDPALPQVVCDGDRMGRVITNLVANAVKYSPEGGAIGVSVRAEGAEAVIGVSDDGVGISAEEIDRLFERFSQADMSSTRAFGGLGLGLFIVDEIVRAHGGSISVQSAPGEGSVFTVRLPLQGP